MSSIASLKKLLAAICDIAEAKARDKEARADGEKHVNLQRVRLGTRLPAYLPQRITPELAETLSEFRDQARRVGIEEFVVQTHFESPMEVTPEARTSIRRLLQAGWTVTNQLVFTAAASRCGHSAKLRQTLSRVGVLPYYTFAEKDYTENNFNFAPIARLVQEELGDKAYGRLSPEQVDRLDDTVADHAEVSPNSKPILRGAHTEKAVTVSRPSSKTWVAATAAARW